jgi:hypothetical protein
MNANRGQHVDLSEGEGYHPTMRQEFFGVLAGFIHLVPKSNFLSDCFADMSAQGGDFPRTVSLLID